METPDKIKIRVLRKDGDRSYLKSFNFTLDIPNADN